MPTLRFSSAKRVCSCGNHAKAFATAFSLVAEEADCPVWHQMVAEYAEILRFGVFGNFVQHFTSDPDEALDLFNKIKKGCNDEALDHKREMIHDLADLIRLVVEKRSSANDPS